MWGQLLGLAFLVAIVSGYCPKEEQKRLKKCLDPIHPLMKKRDNPRNETCKIISKFIRCVKRKLPLCKDFLKRNKVLSISYGLEEKYCSPLKSTTTTTPPPTTQPLPTVHDLFSHCRKRYTGRNHRTRGEACRSAHRFLKCGRSVLWSEDFSIETFYLHAELLRNRAVFWRVCARKTLQQRGVGRGNCPLDVARRMTFCLNVTYWQPVAAGDIKTFCRIGPLFVPCLAQLANDCHQVGRLRPMADFLWNSFDLLSDRCTELDPVSNNVLDYTFDYDSGTVEYYRPPSPQTGGGSRRASFSLSAHTKDVKYRGREESMKARKPTENNVQAAKVPAKNNAQTTRLPAKSNVQTAKLPAKSNVQTAKLPAKSNVQTAKLPAKSNIQTAKLPAKSNVQTAKLPAKNNLQTTKLPAKSSEGRESVSPWKAAAKAKQQQQQKETEARKLTNEVPGETRETAVDHQESKAHPERKQEAARKPDNKPTPSGAVDAKHRQQKETARKAPEGKPRGSRTSSSRRKDAIKAKKPRQKQASRRRSKNKPRGPKPGNPGPATTPPTQKTTEKAKLRSKEASRRRENRGKGGRRSGFGRTTTPAARKAGSKARQKQKGPERAKPGNNVNLPPLTTSPTSPNPRRRPRISEAPRGSQQRRKNSEEGRTAAASGTPGPASTKPTTDQPGSHRREGEKSVVDNGEKKQRPRPGSRHQYSKTSLSKSPSSGSSAEANRQTASRDDDSRYYHTQLGNRRPSGKGTTAPWSSSAGRTTASPRRGATGTSPHAAQAQPTSAASSSSPSETFPAVTKSGSTRSRGTPRTEPEGEAEVDEKETEQGSHGTLRPAAQNPPQRITKTSPATRGLSKEQGKEGTDELASNNAVSGDSVLTESLSGDRVVSETPTGGDDVSTKFSESSTGALPADNAQATSGSGDVGEGWRNQFAAAPLASDPQPHGAALSGGRDKHRDSLAGATHSANPPRGDKLIPNEDEETADALSSEADHRKAGQPNAAAVLRSSDAGKTSTLPDPGTRRSSDNEEGALQPAAGADQDKGSGRAEPESWERLPDAEGNAAQTTSNTDNSEVAPQLSGQAQPLDSDVGDSMAHSGDDTTTLAHAADTTKDAAKKGNAQLSEEMSGQANYPRKQRERGAEKNSENVDTKVDTGTNTRSGSINKGEADVARESKKQGGTGSRIQPVRVTLAQVISGKDKKQNKAKPNLQAGTTDHSGSLYSGATASRKHTKTLPDVEEKPPPIPGLTVTSPVTSRAEPPSQKTRTSTEPNATELEPNATEFERENKEDAAVVAEASHGTSTAESHSPKSDKDDNSKLIETVMNGSGAEPPSLKSENDEAIQRRKELAARGKQDADVAVVSTPIYDNINEAIPPWGRNCSSPWEGHEWCTAIMMRYALAGRGSNQCGPLHDYIVCLTGLVTSCQHVPHFNTLPGTISYVTYVFNEMCAASTTPAYHEDNGRHH